jgi:hypothetical protein
MFSLTASLPSSIATPQTIKSACAEQSTLVSDIPSGSSMNWVLGHIMVHRDYMLVALGEPQVWTDAEHSIYQTGSEPITGPDCPHLPLARLLADLHTAHEQLLETVEIISDEALTAPHNERLSVKERIVSLTWHEAYHTGQTELLRQLAGKNDGVL